MTGVWVVAFALQWTLLVLVAVLLVGVLRYLSSVQERIELAAPHITKFELRDHVSDFDLPDLDGRTVGSSSLIGCGTRAIILLLNPGCSSCKTAMMQVAELASRDGGLARIGWSVVCICSGELAAINQMVAAHEGILAPGVTVLVDPESTIERLYGVRHMPTGIAVGANGLVVDQSYNPHINWLYKTMDVLPPAQAIVEPGRGGWESIAVLPGASGVHTH
ncbi:MAG: TlpA family protein disulfide reductase [Chloroflexota bacterium]